MTDGTNPPVEPRTDAGSTGATRGTSSPRVRRIDGPANLVTGARPGRRDFFADPIGATFASAAQWFRKRRNARFGMRSDMADAILEQLLSRTGNRDELPKIAIVVAHPDDEAIGAGAILRGFPNTTVIHVTDGAPGDVEYARRRGFETREGYAEARRREVVAALQVVGIPADQILGLGFVDGEAAWHLVDLCERMTDLFDDMRPEIVLTHPYEGGHSDHDSTAFAVHLAAGILRREGLQAPIIMELTSYHNYEGRRRLFDFLPFQNTVVRTHQLTEEDREVKRRMFDEFTSQQTLLQTIPIEIERFRQAPRYLFTVPPHEGELDYERLCSKVTGAQWRDQAERALALLRTRKLHSMGGATGGGTATDVS